MKRVFLFILFAGLLLTACNNDNPASKIKDENVKEAQQKLSEMKKFPEMKFDVKEIDFGTHDEGAILDTVFKFTNTGEVPLVISNVKTSCGCTTPYWPKKPIKPGESDVIKVKFNTNHKPGNQVKTITIHTNTKNLTEQIKIKAYINPKSKKDKEKLQKVNNILKNKIDLKQINKK